MKKRRKFHCPTKIPTRSDTPPHHEPSLYTACVLTCGT